MIFAQPVQINRAGAEGLYKGQKNVDQLTLFQSIDSYVWDEDDQKAYYWTCDDLDTGKADGHAKHVRITGVSFEAYGREELITTFPLEIPEDADLVTIYISYRLDVKDAWTEYTSIKEVWGEEEETPGAEYELQNSRILVLNQIVESKGETIRRENILNLDRQYVTEDNKDEGLNLLEYQGALLGADNTGRMSGLFPGWKEDGEFVPFAYPTEELIGRHVLEPAALVPFDRERFQINIRSHYMNQKYEVGWSAGAKYISLQALTDYTGSDKLPMTDTEYDRVDTLEVPQYVQAVEFDYIDGFSVNYLKLPDSVLYVNTEGIPTIEDSGVLEERGLQVVKGYEVTEDNPRYTSENGLLYNKDKTEILGVPTGLEELTVGADIEKVVLPHQNHLQYLRLQITDIEQLPKINYERLSKSGCKIVVPDRLLSAYMEAEKDMLRQTGLKVVAESNLDADCTLQDSFLLRHGSQVQEILCGVPDGIPEFYGVIPGQNGGADIPVTVVGDWAFAENRNGYNLQWLVLPEGVRGVGYEAFKDCWSLEGALFEGAVENGRKEFVIS